MLSIPPYTPQNQTCGIGLATCIKSCVCSSFRLAPSHDAYVFHARSTSGFCICQLRLKTFKFRTTRRCKFPNRSQTIPNDAETEFRKRILGDSQRVWSRDKQKRNKFSKRCIVRCAGYTHSAIYSYIYPHYSHYSQY